MSQKTALLRILGVALLCAAATAPGQSPAPLRVGAARIDITPAADAALPMSGYRNRITGFSRIHDELHVRTIVVDDGMSQAALISVEVIGISHALWETLTSRLTRETGIPREHILLAAIHTHSAPAIGTYQEVAEGDVARRRADYVRKLEDAVVASVQQAQAALQPARVGFGIGRANVNTNRRAANGEGGWMLGNNPDGVSDKTVAVLKFETQAGEPLAIFSNYGVHATVLGSGNLQISADIGGAIARFVERHHGDKIVSPWTSGAAGDQDPIYRVGLDFRNVAALGRLVGEEVVRVAAQIKTSPRGRIRAFQTVVTCPGKRTVQTTGPERRYVTEDAEAVPIRLSLLVLNDIALAGVSGEVLTNIGLRLKQESALSRTLMVTHCNGSSGYLPDDAAYDQMSYEIIAARVKRGFAEDAIVNGFLEMLHRLY